MSVSRRCRSVGLSVKYFLSTSCLFESHVGELSVGELSCTIVCSPLCASMILCKLPDFINFDLVNTWLITVTT